MFALIVENRVLIFDLYNQYGFSDLSETNLSGYIKVIYLKDVLEHFKNYYFNHKQTKKIEKYPVFLFDVCKNYLKDLQLV